MYDVVTMNSEMENIVKDALERRIERTWFGHPFSVHNAEQCCGCQEGRPHSVARESGRSTQAIAEGNDEVVRTTDPPSS